MEEPIRFREHSEYTVNVENISCTVQTVWPSEGMIMEQTSLTNHSHSHAELFACLSGQILLYTEDGTVCLRTGDTAVVPMGYSHRCEPAPDSRWLSFSFLCLRRRAGSLDLMRKLERICSGESIFLLPSVPEICHSLAALPRSGEWGPGYLYALRFLSLLLQIAESGTRQERAAPGASGGEMDRMSRLDSLVNEHYMTDLTAARTAEILCISTRQLSRIVQKRYGAPLRQVLLEKRVATAAKMLSETDSSIDNIGFEVGFRSRAAFYRAFGEIMGITPAVYRKRCSRPSGGGPK